MPRSSKAPGRAKARRGTVKSSRARNVRPSRADSRASTGSVVQVMPAWDDADDKPDLVADIEAEFDTPVKADGYNVAARRRIEMMHEERMLQDALHDAFEY